MAAGKLLEEDFPYTEEVALIAAGKLLSEALPIAESIFITNV